MSPVFLHASLVLLDTGSEAIRSAPKSALHALQWTSPRFCQLLLPQIGDLNLLKALSRSLHLVDISLVPVTTDREAAQPIHVYALFLH